MPHNLRMQIGSGATSKKFGDNVAGALKAYNHDYDETWTLADTRGMPDPEVPGVWLLVNDKAKLSVIVNAFDGQVVDEVDYEEVLGKYGSMLSPRVRSKKPAIPTHKPMSMETVVKLDRNDLRKLIRESFRRSR